MVVPKCQPRTDTRDRIGHRHRTHHAHLQRTIDLLQQWSQTLAVEYIIAALKQESKPELLKALAGYPQFYLPVISDDNGDQIILTPDL